MDNAKDVLEIDANTPAKSRVDPLRQSIERPTIMDSKCDIPIGGRPRIIYCDCSIGIGKTDRTATYMDEMNMIPAFLAQYSAGCFLAMAVLATRRCGWRYFRLMAIVSVAIGVLAIVLLVRQWNVIGQSLLAPAPILFGVGCLFGLIWLFVNAAQGQAIGQSQRVLPALSGVAMLSGSVWMILCPVGRQMAEGAAHSIDLSCAMGFSLLLGALLMGSATSAMLLGHRYLTDIDMPIAPLRRMTIGYLLIVTARIVWVAAASIPVRSAAFHPSDYFYFWLALAVRIGVGLLVVAVFAWMVWDCVRRRATQSATALFYLSMVMVFIGELAGQYLMHSEHLAL